MRSMFMLAALAAVISFSGCCGTGGGCKLGGCLGGGKAVVSSAGAQSSCGCSSGGCSSGGCSSGGCSSGGCSSGGCGVNSSGAAVGACGAGSVVTVSAPYACDGGCGASAPMSAPSSCGCSSCDGGGAVEYAPAQYAPPVQYAPIEYAPAAPVQSGGCSACGTASVDEPSRGQARRAARKEGLSNNRGMGLLLKDKGKACAEPAGLGSRRRARSLNQSAGSNYTNDLGFSTGGSCDSCDAGAIQTVSNDGFLFGSASGGRRISSGVVSDIREARGGRGCGTHGCGLRKAASAAAGPAVGGCGHRGCGAKGKLCDKCIALAHATGRAHPYGGGIPHTNPAAGQQPQSGIAPQYAYPYYTTRGPRDFLRDNPPSIGY